MGKHRDCLKMEHYEGYNGGVYALLKDKKVVYIGKFNSGLALKRRIDKHLKGHHHRPDNVDEPKDFDEFLVISDNPGDEGAYVAGHEPILNKQKPVDYTFYNEKIDKTITFENAREAMEALGYSHHDSIRAGIVRGQKMFKKWQHVSRVLKVDLNKEGLKIHKVD